MNPWPGFLNSSIELVLPVELVVLLAALINSLAKVNVALMLERGGSI
jgi:hypothetical protein